MIYNRTYLDKFATIVKSSNNNTGFNPVSDLLYGRNNSRALIHFDHNRIKKMVEENVFPDMSKLKHRLKIKNAGSIDMSQLHKVYGSQIDGLSKKRATSFDLIFFLIPCEWDNGKGFDYTKSYFDTEFYNERDYEIKDYISEDGATWYKPLNGSSWKENIEYQKTNDGLLSFFIKSDKVIASQSGDEVVFTFTVSCNGFEQLKNVKLKQINPYSDMNPEIGSIIYFSNGGYICHTEEDILKYAKYGKLITKFPKNNLEKDRKYSFILECEIDGKTYKSNPYRITQNGKDSYTYPITDDGIYSTDTLENQLGLFENGNESIIIGKQHFDIGCEDIDIDITDTFNKFISGELENYGIGIAFSPKYEASESQNENYFGMFTNRTNTFFEPYVETIYYDSIHDDRQNFILGKANRLYLYANIGGNLENLDELPTCSVDGVEYEVKQGSKGAYYIDITLPPNVYTSPTMLYDKWGNIKYKGEVFSDVEMEFTTQPAVSYFNIFNRMPEKASFTPTVYGINNGEHVTQNDIRKVCFLFKKDYAKNTAVIVDEVEVRLYVMDGTAQITVMPYIKTERSFTDTYITIDTNMLVPNTYHMDVRVKYGMEMIEHHDILNFTVVNEENNKYV